MGWGILKLHTMNSVWMGDMFRDLWHCCLLISNPVYLMVDSAYSGCCFSSSPVVTGIASMSNQTLSQVVNKAVGEDVLPT